MATAAARSPARSALRLQAGGVSLLAGAVFTLSAWSALSQPIWSVIDENLHFAYAQSLAQGQGLPRADRPTQVIPTAAPVDWNARISLLNAEAAQPPLNYLLLAGAYRAAIELPGGSARTAVYAMRLSNSVLFAALVLLLWLSARLIRPGSLAMALGLPASCLMWVGTITDSTRAGNDVLVGCLATLGIYLALRWRLRFTWRLAAVVGLVIAAATLARYSGMYSLVVVSVVVLAGSQRRRQVARGLAAAWLAWACAVAPWFAIQYSRYGDPTAAAAFGRAIQPWDRLSEVNLGTIASWVRAACQSLVFGEQSLPTWTPTQQLIGFALIALAVVSVAALFEVGRSTTLTRLEYAGLLLNLPGFFLFETVLSFRSGVILTDRGRYLLPVALPLALLLAGGVSVLGSGWIRRSPDPVARPARR